MRKVAIIGRCDNTRKDAPWMDPEWEKWGLAWDLGFAGDLYFEAHTPNTWHDNMLGSNCRQDTFITYRQYLELFPQERPYDKLVLLEHYFPGVIRYPMEKVAAEPLLCFPGTSDPYLESSLGYMLAMAKVGEDGAAPAGKVGLYGIDLTADDEWSYQRPNLAYLVAVCRYSGLPVMVPQASEMNELRKLDEIDLAAIDWMDEKPHRHYLEYLLGKARALGRMPTKYRADLMTTMFSNPSRYGYCELPSVTQWGKRVFLNDPIDCEQAAIAQAVAKAQEAMAK